MKPHPLAKRYARALYQLAVEAKTTVQILDELRQVEALLHEQPRIKTFLMSPEVEKKRKIEVLDSLFKGNASPLFYHFMKVLVEKGRQNYFPEIVYEFNRFKDQSDGRIRAQLISAVPLQAEQVDRVRQQLGSYLKAEIILENKVDAAILGGVIIKVEGKVIDGSLRQQFNRLRRELLQVKHSV